MIVGSLAQRILILAQESVIITAQVAHCVQMDGISFTAVGAISFNLIRAVQ